MSGIRRIGMILFAAVLVVSGAFVFPSASARTDRGQATEAVGFMFASDLNNRCLTIAHFNRENGAGLHMYDCNGSDSQRWSWDGSLLRSDLNGKCLDASFGNGDNGAMINMFDCHGEPAQQWYRNGGELRSRTGNRCLTIPGGNWWTGAAVVLWDCTTAREQQWHLT